MRSDPLGKPKWRDGATAVHFLQALRPDGPWCVTALYVDDMPRVDGDVGPAPTRTFTDPDDLRQWIDARNGRANLYHTPNRLKRSMDKKPSEADLGPVDVVFTDIDVDKRLDEITPEKLNAAKREALALVLESETPPFRVVNTAGGLQPIWKLEEPVDVATAKGIIRGLTERFDGDTAVVSPSHLLRLPGAVNIPDKRKRDRGRFIDRTSLAQKTDNRLWPTSAFPVGAVTPKAAELSITPEYIDDLDEVIEEYRLSERLVTIIKDGRLEKSKPGKDSRSEWLFDCCAGLDRHGVPPEIIAGIILDGRFRISESVLEREERGDDVRYAIHTISNAIADNKQRAEKKRAEARDDFDAIAPARRNRKERLRARSLADLMDLPDPEFLVDGMVPETGVGTYYGPPFGGKTASMIDMGMHIALGREYHGMKTKRGKVVHIAAEGSPARIRERALAWCTANSVDWQETVGWWSLVDVPVYLDNPEAVEAWLDANRDPDGTFQRALVIVDTQARNMAGNENAAQDISNMIAGIDRIREDTGGFVLRIHHEGREAKTGGRGSTAGAGADDLTLHLSTVEKGKRVCVEVENMRDGEAGASLVLALRSQAFMFRGAERTSVVTVLSHADTVERLLVRIYEEQPISIKDLIGEEEGFSKANVYKLADRARAGGWVRQKPEIGLTGAGRARAQSLGAREPTDLDFEPELSTEQGG
jgi:hypothetical protein